MSALIDSRGTGRFFPNLIPPEIGKGELVTGGRNIGTDRRRYLESIRLPTDLDKIVVQAGDDGSVLQADSSTATGLKWVPHEPIAVSLNKKIDSIVKFFKPLVRERVAQEAKRVESMPKLYVRSSIDGINYTIPYNSTNNIQSVIDYLDETFLVSLINNCSQVNVIFESKKLEPNRTLADYGIQNESTIYLLCVQSGVANAGGGKGTRKKCMSKRNGKCKRNLK